MDIKWTYSTGGVPSRQEIALWNDELRLFQYQPPDPNSQSEARRRGWGFHPAVSPPVDCYDYVAANLKRLWKVRQDDKFRPEARYALLSVLSTYFAWLRTESGTRWLLALYGIRILRPHPGMVYLHQGERLVEPQFGLRIYDVDSMHQVAKSPDEVYGPGLFEKLRELLEQARGPAPPCAPLCSVDGDCPDGQHCLTMPWSTKTCVNAKESCFDHAWDLHPCPEGTFCNVEQIASWDFQTACVRACDGGVSGTCPPGNVCVSLPPTLASHVHGQASEMRAILHSGSTAEPVPTKNGYAPLKAMASFLDA